MSGEEVATFLTMGVFNFFLSVSVGYEYESCLDVVLWEKRTAVLQGYELDASNMGGWTLDKHHILDIQNGKRCIHTERVSECVGGGACQAKIGRPFRIVSSWSLP